MVKKMLAAGGYDFGNTKLQNVQDGTASSDAATKGQMDAAIAAVVSGLDYKGSVRVASTGNVNIASAPSTIDGVTLANGDRVLLKDQSTPEQNGIRVFTSAGAAMARATDADVSSEVTSGMWVTVEEGTANADTQWLLTTNNPITLDTTGLTFQEFPFTSGGGGPVGYTATGPSSGGTTWTVTHNLGTRAIVWSVQDVSDNSFIDVHGVATDTNTLTLTSSATLGSNGYRVTVIPAE